MRQTKLSVHVRTSLKRPSALGFNGKRERRHVGGLAMALPRTSSAYRSRLLPLAGMARDQERGIRCQQAMVWTCNADMRALRCLAPVLLDLETSEVSFRIDHANAACSMRKEMAWRSHFPSLNSSRARARSEQRSDVLLNLQPREGQPINDQLEGIATQTFRSRLPEDLDASPASARASRLERLNSELTDSTRPYPRRFGFRCCQ